jgi:calcineurin-like phosphoesterase family protein
MRMAERIAAMPVRHPFSFVIAGDSGAWPDPTADAIVTELLRQTARLEPRPVFFANLGDFAGPGTIQRHEHYLRLVEPLPLPDVCVVGNHDLDDPAARDAWAQVHGPMNFEFAYGQTRFVAIDAAPAAAAKGTDSVCAEGDGRPEDRVMLMHCPPHFDVMQAFDPIDARARIAFGA